MKKYPLVIALTFFLLFVIAWSRKEPKEYTFKFTEAQVGELWNVVQQSNAPHLQVQEIQNAIQSQYSAQIQKDSINNKK